MIKYYCSGFNIDNAFGHGLGDMIKSELSSASSIVYIPGGAEKVEKAFKKYIPSFRNHFKNIGIEFDEEIVITPDIDKTIAQDKIRSASFIMLMGGNPFALKEMCDSLGLLPLLKEYNGVMLGYSAGAMLMSKYIIVTPCSEEYPDFRIEEGLNLDGISIYPHNNTSIEEYPEELVVGGETYKRNDLISVAKEYGDYYLLQDNFTQENIWDISIIKSTNGVLDFYTENQGKIWTVTKDGVKLMKLSKTKGMKK